MKPPRRQSQSRLERRSGPSLGGGRGPEPEANAVLDCGWGRLIFAHTFASPEAVAQELLRESAGTRDIAFYVADPHVVLARAPQDLFLDPSDTYRLWLSNYRPGRRRPRGFTIAPARVPDDIDAINRIYLARRMMPLAPSTPFTAKAQRRMVLVARDDASDRVIGVVMGVDHVATFDDSEGGTSLWSLAVDPQAQHPGIGEALTRQLAERFKARGRAFMDLSVLHDNSDAIALYQKLGFQQVTTFAVKTRNPINEGLFTGPKPGAALNPYAAIIVNEARRRGIGVDIDDAARGYFTLEFGGRSIRCRESLSELTSAVALSICDDKAATRKRLTDAGLNMPEQAEAGIDPAADAVFLARHGSVVVKPARGEQGRGITVGITSLGDLAPAVAAAREVSQHVLIEQFMAGDDLRLVVIGDAVVAAAVRRPPEVAGNGTDTIATLIGNLSRRREAATQGESRVPLDAATRACVTSQGYDLDDVLEYGARLAVRRTANLHTGGTITDVTARLHPSLAEAALAAARAINIPVAGIDMIVPSVEAADYAIIEVNERPGLANHEPQPTGERFIDLLFPQTVSQATKHRPQHGSTAS